MTTLDALPRWDLTPLFPTVDHAEVAAAEGTLTRAVDALAALFDRRDVRGAADGASPAAAVDPAAFDEVLAATNHVLDRFARLEAFAYGHVSTDSGDEAAQALISRLTTVEARITALRTRFDAWVGTLDLHALIAASPEAAAHAWPLRKAARRATHQMSEPEESLAAELGITGSSAWSRLYDDVSAGVTATVEHADGRTETLPIFAVRGLATHPDAAVRAAAFRAELAA